MPSTREIQLHFGFASQTAAVEVLRAMERKGVLRRLPGKARGIVLNGEHAFEKPAGVIGVPFDGAAAEDEPVYVDAKTSGLDVKGALFALKVTSDSLVADHILEGDIVIADRGRKPGTGDIVAIRTDDSLVLKRFAGTENGSVQGVVSALVRPAPTPVTVPA